MKRVEGSKICSTLQSLQRNMYGCAVVLILLYIQFTPLMAEGSFFSKCDIKQPSRGILDLKHPFKPAKLLNATSAFSLKNCSQLCCKAIKCNAYIWRNSEQCFLFHCKVMKECKVVPYQGAVTGFVSREAVTSQGSENDSEDTNSSEKSISKDVAADDKTQTDQQRELENDSQSKADSPLPAGKIESLSQSKNDEVISLQVADNEDKYDQSKRTSQGQNTTSAPKNSSIAATLSTARPVTRKGTNSKRTTLGIPVLNSSLTSNKASHTTTTSLIAALTFGMVFFAAVAILIGKPWWQSLCAGRDGYNRVTFLMNGR